jgi:heptosyltransferase-3
MLSLFLEKIFNLCLHRKWSLSKENFDLARISRILVVRNDNIGDVLCSTPAIRSLRRAFPRAYIAALVVRYSQDAITGNPDLDEVFIYEKAKHRPDRNRIISLYKQFLVELGLRKKRFDLAIGLRSTFSWSEAWLVYFTGAPFRVGYEPDRKKDWEFAFFYNFRVPPPPQEHEVEKTLRLAERIGVPPAEKNLIVTIPEEEKKVVESFLSENAIDPQRLIGFHLSSRVPANRWGQERFAELAHRLIHGDGKAVVLTWAPGDENRAEEVHRQVGMGVYSFPTPHFKRLGAIQQRCRVFVSPDGGAMHFAAAVGTSTVGLFGKTNPQFWAPWGDGHVALRKGTEADLISVDEVYQAVHQMIQQHDMERA